MRVQDDAAAQAGKVQPLALKAATKGSYRYDEDTTPASNESLKPPKAPAPA